MGPIPGKPLAAFNLPGWTKTMTDLTHQPVLNACRTEAVKYLGARIRRGYGVLETLEHPRYGHDGQRKRVAHMPTATTSTAGS